MKRLGTIRSAGRGRVLKAILMIVSAFGVTSHAQQQQQREHNDQKGNSVKAEKRSREAAKVFYSIMRAEDRAIPKDLFNSAKAVAVFPSVYKAAFVLGGQGGGGIVARRTPKGRWSAPAFFKLGGGSYGAQIGVSKTDYVLLFMNDEALQGLLGEKFEFGGEASVAAGPVGRTVAASTDPSLRAGILTYSRSKGVFAGVSLKGAVITPDDDMNRSVYGRSGVKEVFDPEAEFKLSEGVDLFPQTLSRFTQRAR